MPSSRSRGQRGGDGAHADAGLGGNSGVGRIQPPRAVVQEVEDQCVQYLQGRVTDGAPMLAGLVGAAVEVPGAVPELDCCLLGQRDEADGVGDTAGPDRPGRIGL